jgi:iron complex transport system ATP-binding protein
LNAEWRAGSLVAVLGPNGIGKSTLLNHVAGIALRQQDCVRLKREDIATMPPRLRAQKIASIAQQDSAPLEMIVRDRIAHGLHPRRFCAAAERSLVERTASTLQIKDLLERPLHSLSGGQRKKVHVARALVDDQAEVYILDEPDAGLDANSRDHVMRLLRSLATSGKLVIVSLHHQDLAEAHADLIIDLQTLLPLHSTSQ